MKLKSIFTESIAVAALSIAGIAAIGNTKNNEAQAAIVENDASVYTVHKDTKVYNSYKKGKKARKQVLDAGTSWKVIKTAYDKKATSGTTWARTNGLRLLRKNQFKLKIPLLLKHQRKTTLLQVKIPQLFLVQKQKLRLGSLTKNLVVHTPLKTVLTLVNINSHLHT